MAVGGPEGKVGGGVADGGDNGGDCDAPRQSPDYCRIASERHAARFARLYPGQDSCQGIRWGFIKTRIFLIAARPAIIITLGLYHLKNDLYQDAGLAFTLLLGYLVRGFLNLLASWW